MCNWSYNIRLVNGEEILQTHDKRFICDIIQRLTAYVRPHLEFCVQAWSPYMAKDIDSLEKVKSQRRATKLVISLAKLTYEQRLSKTPRCTAKGKEVTLIY